MPIADLPPTQAQALTCIIAAAARYEVPNHILLAIAEKEGGKPGQWVRNANGTSDIGPMQFNTAYLAELAPYGITPQVVANGGCYAYVLAAWRVRRHLLYDNGDMWTRAANYHSRTPHINAAYRSDLITKSTRWANWLEKNAKKQRASLGANGRPNPVKMRDAQIPLETARYVSSTITASSSN